MALVVISIILVALLFGRRQPDRPDTGNPDLPASPDNPVSVPLVIARWVPQIKKAAADYGIDYSWPMGILWVESFGQPAAIGSADERGLMQLKNIAVEDLRQNGYGDFPDWRTNPETNIRAGVAFLHLQLRPGRAAGNIREAVRAYNQGFAGKDASQRQIRAANEYLEKVENRRNFFA